MDCISEPVGLPRVQVYALHLVVPAGAATELIESISKSANKYGKKMQFHKPGMKEAPNPVCHSSADAAESVCVKSVGWTVSSRL